MFLKIHAPFRPSWFSCSANIWCFVEHILIQWVCTNISLMYVTHISKQSPHHPAFLALSQGLRVVRAGANCAIGTKQERPDNRLEIIRTAPFLPTQTHSQTRRHISGYVPSPLTYPSARSSCQHSQSPLARHHCPLPVSSRPKLEPVPSSAGWQCANGLNKDQVAESRNHDLICWKTGLTALKFIRCEWN